MAEWKFGLNSQDNQIDAKVDYSDEGHVDFVMRQHNIEDIKREVERDRAILAEEKKVGSWRKAFTIPDIVAVEILMKHGLDVHSSTFMSDYQSMNKLKYIVKTEYPHLLVST